MPATTRALRPESVRPAVIITRTDSWQRRAPDDALARLLHEAQHARHVDADQAQRRSLGIYLTFDPRVERLDSEHNCISNIRNGGLRWRGNHAGAPRP